MKILRRFSQRKKIKLGDAVARVAKPIASIVDAGLGTVGIHSDLKNCPGCNKRQEDLNHFSI